MSSIKTFDELPRPMQGTGPAAVPGRRAVPLVGVIRNPRSHRNTGREQGAAPGYDVIVETTRKRRELGGVLDRFAKEGIDYLAISGGDGTVRDVLTSGSRIFGENWPPLIVLPKGKTNALGTDLGVPADWRLAQALDAARAGKLVTRRPLVVADAGDPGARVLGFVLGTGVFHRAVGLGQDAHRWGAFNALAVGVTSIWALGQAILAGRDNAWRQRSLIRLVAQDGRPLPGSDRRFLMLASTLERFGPGLKPFGPSAPGLKLVALDTPSRRNLLAIPAVALGHLPRSADERGFHRLRADEFAMTIDTPFILDGEAFLPGQYHVSTGPLLRFAVP